MNPAVSVVIPSYNHAAFVAQAIQSVLDQSFTDLEIVVTDDGSSDGTPDVIRRFCDARIDLEVFPRNRGAVDALNDSIRRSRGEFVCYLSSDDFFLPGKLQKQIDYLRAHPRVGAVFALAELVDEGGRPLGAGNGYFAMSAGRVDKSRAQWLRQFFYHGNCLCHPAAMIRREVLDEVGPFDPRLVNLPDFDMWVRICMTHDIHVMQEKLTGFRIRDNERNVSAWRRDSALRGTYEFYRVLMHYRTLSPALGLEAFAEDLRRTGIDAARPYGAWLAELAFEHGDTAHVAFAFDTMYEASAHSGSECRRLTEWTGKVDLYHMEAQAKIKALQDEIGRLRGPGIRASNISGAWGQAGRNEPCPCGSGKKYKHCHGQLT